MEAHRASLLLTRPMMIGAEKGIPLYLSDEKLMTVWNLPSTAAGPSFTCILLLRVTVGELLWPLLSACASCSVSSFVDRGDTHTDLGLDRELCPTT